MKMKELDDKYITKKGIKAGNRRTEAKIDCNQN